MEIHTLCDKIQLQPEIESRVIDFVNDFDFNSVNKQLKGFQNYEKMSEALSELQTVLGEDTNNIRILACMLKASADVYKIYKDKGISDKIYFDTMKCYPRFIDETYKMTGKLYFDRCWWTTRQAGCHLFRIGELEYEMKHIDDKIVIGIHIPSDADFSPCAVDKSLMKAKKFFTEYYPDLANAEYRCHSWLLDNQLKGMLNENSNIINFQNRFEIFDEGEIGTDFIEWLYNTESTDYSALPENTALQRNMKRHLLSGGVIRNAYGRLK
ncbi:acyltransferase domain-containing protein [Pseudoruminococcus massiliensis]|uniref:acyltransferase domain-containing protein n=1 Tax=Pseudoruminococcus massiliensis TaxID=2086583 RepID=UPI003AB3B0A4